MHVIRRCLPAPIIERKNCLRVKIALHQHRDRILVTGIKVRRQNYAVNIGVWLFLLRKQQRQKLCPACRQRLCHIANVSSCLFAVCEHYKALAVLRRNHHQRLRHGLLKICRRFLRHCHQPGIMLLTCQKLLDQRIFSKCHNPIDISSRHMADSLRQILLHLPNVCLITVGIIHHKHRGGLAASLV